MTNLDSILKSRDITSPTKVHLVSQSYGFSSSHVRMWELDYKESWVPKNWWFWTVMLEKTLESPLDSKKIKPVSPKGNQSWIFIGRTDAKTPILWPPDVKNWLIGKDSDAGKDWRQEEKGTTEAEMVGWHHRLNGPEFEQTWVDSEGQRSLVCCSSWGRKESDTTWWLNNNKIEWQTVDDGDDQNRRNHLLSHYGHWNISSTTTPPEGSIPNPFNLSLTCNFEALLYKNS